MMKYYPVTEEELNIIKNDCKYPEKNDCDGCEHVDEDLGCSFKGANVLMDEVMERTDSMEVLENWVKAYDCGGAAHNNIQELLTIDMGDAESIDIELAMIKELQENLQGVIERGKREGWLK